MSPQERDFNEEYNEKLAELKAVENELLNESSGKGLGWVQKKKEEQRRLFYRVRHLKKSLELRIKQQETKNG